MSSLNRRNFLSLFGAAGVAATFGSSAVAAPAAKGSQDFDFIFLTDTHIQPELDATKGCDMAFKKMRTIRADFAIQGGDHVFDSLAVPKERSLSLFELYDKTSQDLSLKVHHAIGNHDVFGIYPASGMQPDDPLYGKKYFSDHIGKTYYSFDHKGVHFIVLDSIGITGDRAYEGRIDAEQLAWLAGDLKAQSETTPIVVTTHVPLVTAYDNYNPVPATPVKHHGISVINTNEVFPLFQGRNVLGVLQGHTHVNERVEWQGVPYITSGAVSGNWWKGVHLGSPEGFTVVSIRNGKLATRYETYGFKSVAPENS